MFPELITLDVAFEGSEDTLEASLANLAPTGILYRIESLTGPAGGWPEVTFRVETQAQAEELASWYVGYDVAFVVTPGETLQDAFLGAIGA